MKRLLIWITLLGVLTALPTGAGLYWGWRTLHTPLAPPVGGALVSIPSGAPFQSICNQLEAAGVVQHAWLLHVWGRWQQLDRLVRSGDYRFDRPLSPLQVLAALRSPTAALNRVTIPEGYTIRQTFAALARAGFGTEDAYHCLAQDADFLQSLDLPATGLEGYLFPDTYAFVWTVSPAEVLRTMVQRFREQVATLQRPRLDADMREADMVILASIIEKETGVAHERPRIAGVFHNRLRIGMRLQSDPTAMYGREEEWPPTAADLRIDTPYNTYLHDGLTPGPICNPGLAALTAAVQPEDVPYLYFVADAEGAHTFSRTLREHNRAVATLRRKRR